MRRHNIFTLGIILTSVYGINAMAAWPTTPATNIWADSGHTTLAQMRCGDCCKTDCWLPSGTYYDAFGTFSESCTGEPSEPTCDSDRTYSMVNGVCKKDKLSCPDGQYDIGFSSCIDVSIQGNNHYCNFGSSCSGIKKGQWELEFSYGVVKGMASCNGTKGQEYVATDQEFSNTANGKNCWCKMTSPAASRWVFLLQSSSKDNCTNYCTEKCSKELTSNWSDFRSGVYGSVEL